MLIMVGFVNLIGLSGVQLDLAAIPLTSSDFLKRGEGENAYKDLEEITSKT